MAAPFTPPKLQKRSLKGHNKAVLCLAYSTERLAYTPKSKKDIDVDGIAHPNLLLSGSEDGTARLWDLRTRKTAYCIIIPKSEDGEALDVNSVAFHPSILDGYDGSKTAESILDGSKDCTVYVTT